MSTAAATAAGTATTIRGLDDLIGRLPLHVWIDLFSQLDLVDLLTVIVSKSWATFLRSPAMQMTWRQIYLRRFGSHPSVPRSLGGVTTTTNSSTSSSGSNIFPLPSAAAVPAVACWQEAASARHLEQTDWLWRTRSWADVKAGGHVRETFWVGPGHEFASLRAAVQAASAFDKVVVDCPPGHVFPPEVIMVRHSIEICGSVTAPHSPLPHEKEETETFDDSSDGPGRQRSMPAASVTVNLLQQQRLQQQQREHPVEHGDDDDEEDNDGGGEGEEEAPRYIPANSTSFLEVEHPEAYEAAAIRASRGVHTPPPQLDVCLLMAGPRTCVRLHNLWLRPGHAVVRRVQQQQQQEQAAVVAAEPLEAIAGVSVGKNCHLQADDCIFEHATLRIDLEEDPDPRANGRGRDGRQGQRAQRRELGDVIFNRCSLLRCDAPPSITDATLGRMRSSSASSYSSVDLQGSSSSSSSGSEAEADDGVDGDAAAQLRGGGGGGEGGAAGGDHSWAF
eukprot:g3762.t1